MGSIKVMSELLANKIAAGTSATTFEPNSNCARSAIITFIARAYQDNVA